MPDETQPKPTTSSSTVQITPVGLTKNNVRSHTLPLLLLALLITVITGTMYMVAPLHSTNGGVIPSRPTLFPYATDTPTPTPITSAITIKGAYTAYLNLRLNYTINYPSTWRYSEFSRDFAYLSNSDGVAFNPISDKTPPDAKYALVTIEIEQNPDNINVDEYLSKYIFCNESSAASNNCPVKSFGDVIKMGGIDGKIATISAVTPMRLAVVAHGGKMYSFRLTLNDAYKNLYSKAQKEELFRQMLSTLQFLDNPTPTPEDTGIIGKIDIKVCNPDDLQFPTPGVTPPSCTQPYKSSVIIKTEDGSQELAKVTSDENGSFKVNLPVGNYLVQPLPNPGPTNSSGFAITVTSSFQKVAVLNHKLTAVFIHYDATGH